MRNEDHMWHACESWRKMRMKPEPGPQCGAGSTDETVDSFNCRRDYLT